jgi:ABC-type polar amino acid transport system ATPase subunit
LVFLVGERSPDHGEPGMWTGVVHCPEAGQIFGEMTVLVEQDSALALEVGQRVYVLDSGRVVMEGPPAVIAQNPTIREVYLGIA